MACREGYDCEGWGGDTSDGSELRNNGEQVFQVNFRINSPYI